MFCCFCIEEISGKTEHATITSSQDQKPTTTMTLTGESFSLGFHALVAILNISFQRDALWGVCISEQTVGRSLSAIHQVAVNWFLCHWMGKPDICLKFEA